MRSFRPHAPPLSPITTLARSCTSLTILAKPHECPSRRREPYWRVRAYSPPAAVPHLGSGTLPTIPGPIRGWPRYDTTPTRSHAIDGREHFGVQGGRGGRITLLTCLEKCHDGLKVVGLLCFCTFRVHFGTLICHKDVRYIQGQAILTLSVRTWQQIRFPGRNGGRSNGIPMVSVSRVLLRFSSCIMSRRHIELLCYLLQGFY